MVAEYIIRVLQIYNDLMEYADIVHMNNDEAIYFIKCLGLKFLEKLVAYNELLFIITDSWRPLYIIFDKQILMIKPIRLKEMK